VLGVSAPKIKNLKAMRRPTALVVGSSIYVVVSICGKPMPHVQWSKDGVELIADVDRVSIETSEGWSRLRVRAVTPTDAGNYCVTASNVAGTDNAYFTIIVRGSCATAALPDFLLRMSPPYTCLCQAKAIHKVTVT